MNCIETERNSRILGGGDDQPYLYCLITREFHSLH